MQRNVEIKARIHEDFNNFCAKVKELSRQDGILLSQEDTFFNSLNGRLKLRQSKDAMAQLIFYNRPDTEGPKLSKCFTSEVTNAVAVSLQKTLTEALGVRSSVKKRRLLFHVGQTRIHVDQVESLGNFVELEVMLAEEETPEHGQEVAQKLMRRLGLTEGDLLATAYADMLCEH